MTEDQLYATIGRQHLELRAMHAEYTRLLQVLHEVAVGNIAADRVTVDAAARTWAVAPPETATPETSTD